MSAIDLEKGVTVTDQNHMMTKSVSHLARSSKFSRIVIGEKVKVDITRPTDCDPISATSTANGRAGKPNLRATIGDWSTYEC